ncbi:hypothetical protein AVEN_48858-1 [Araneus ventricosus]|uniref:Uncharacterized protein n=1 Tax=Araneus ventricosus TaxID=182803 RepID=A0A4Y2AIW0_ARAVE|nr:hypothetical protein AVEN_48858-1 [Araneus ventricosus]
MEKWLKTGAPKRPASRTEIRTTDLAAMEITVDRQDDNHEMQRPTDWPAQHIQGDPVLNLVCRVQFRHKLISHKSSVRMDLSEP